MSPHIPGTAVVNTSGRPELVLNQEEWDLMKRRFVYLFIEEAKRWIPVFYTIQALLEAQRLEQRRMHQQYDRRRRARRRRR